MRETTEMWIQERERDERRGRETEKERGGREGGEKEERLEVFFFFFFVPSASVSPHRGTPSSLFM